MHLSDGPVLDNGERDKERGNPSTPRVAAVLPAYNEAKNIGTVLDILRQVRLLSEIIVVDDGSQDGTAEVVRQKGRMDPRIRLLIHPVNSGKGEALFTGWSATGASSILMLDADLIHLKPEHVLALIEPVMSRQADMTMGLFKRGRWFTDFSHWLTPWLTGQRCFRSELFRFVLPRAASGYGFETAITIAARERGWRCLPVPMVGVSHLPSESHRGLVKGLLTRMKMYHQVVLAWYLTGSWQRFVSRIRMWARQG
jgi:glycosyltransferase involved in cell wall biosynthesis